MLTFKTHTDRRMRQTDKPGYAMFRDCYWEKFPDISAENSPDMDMHGKRTFKSIHFEREIHFSNYATSCYKVRFFQVFQSCYTEL